MATMRAPQHYYYRQVARQHYAAVMGGASSAASTMLAGETQGLALDFTDSFWQPTTGFYGSARIIDTGTPANNYDSSPTKTASSLLTMTSPSLKWTIGPNGLGRFQAHNLYLNSASPANQSITVVSGATYAVTITGTVSVTASGAATGTWTAGTNTFTAATTTLTLGSTSGSGTVHVRRTPSDSTYLATAAAIRYALPLEWSSAGVLQGLLVEEGRTNLVTYSDDLTNAAWSKANTTAAKTATGPDGIANSASTVTASAVNGAIWQRITSASAARITSLYIKRRTGSGGVFLAKQSATATQITGFDGTFATSTGWSTSTGVTITGGVASCSATNGFNLTTSGAPLTVGKSYIVTYTVLNYSAGSVQVRGGSQGAGTTRSANGTYTEAVTCQGNTNLFFNFGTFTGDIDDVTIYEADETTLTVTSEWTRVSEASHTSTNPLIAIRLATSGDAIDVALVQHEVGAFITSPIPTLGAFVSRNVDNISLATSAFPLGTSHTMFADFKLDVLDDAATMALSLQTASGDAEAIWLYSIANRLEVRSTSVARAAIDGANIAAAGNYKIAGAVAVDDAAYYVGGAQVGTDAGLTPMPAGVDTLYLGSYRGQWHFNGYIRKAMYLPRRVTNAQLQTLTT